MIRWILNNLGGSRAPNLEDLKEWKEENVGTIINLVNGEYGKVLADEEKKQGFNVVRIPFSMADPVPAEEFLAMYDYVDELLKNNQKVVVHCKYGQSRSGTFLAGYLIYKGVPYSEAIERVMEKGFFPSTDYQIKFLQDLEKAVKK
jgi:protein-tyrosine phosphatase